MKIIGTLAVGLISLIACGLGLQRPHEEVRRSPAKASESQQVVTRRIDFGDVLESASSTNSVESAVSKKQEETADENRVNLQHKISLLEKGDAFLAGIDGYCATLAKQEVVGSELLDEQTIQMKCRHKPFSVYLNWLTVDPGREVIYIEGQNDGKMIAHDGGWKARIPAFTLDPECRLAMRDARYPVTTAGIANLAKTMLDIHREDLQRDSVATCLAEENQSFDGRGCTVFTTQYKSPGTSPTYRKSITYIDDEWNLPVYSRHFAWTESGKGTNEDDLDASTLIESYSFTDLKLSHPLSDSDFDRDNSEYRFR